MEGVGLNLGLGMRRASSSKFQIYEICVFGIE